MAVKPTYEELEKRIQELERTEFQLKQSEEKIQEQYRFLKTLFDVIPFPFYLKDRNAKYLGCSPSYAEIIGMKTEEVVGKRAEDIFPDDIAAKHNKRDQDLFRNPGKQVYEYRFRYADGSMHDNIVSKATFNDTNESVEKGSKSLATFKFQRDRHYHPPAI